MMIHVFYPFPNEKILNLTKMKALNVQTNKLNIAKMTISPFDEVENTVDKGENAVYQHFPIVFNQSLLL